ncbi:MAG: phosphonate ABC transporter, permease protein PhnE [Burkholderiaceae bacterium]|nr:phosphonate ABC transporter, permease protein PhnE [Burkholderiaceae bacterium]
MNPGASATAPGARSYPQHWRATSIFGSPGRRMAFWLVVAAYMVWAIGDLRINWERILKGFPRALDIFARMFPPAVDDKWTILVNGMTESVQMAIASSIAGIVLAIPLALCAARNLAPRPVYLAARGLIVVGRTFHEVLIAIFFVKLFGFGPVAGLLTLAFSSAIFLAKMLAEDIENIASGPVEALRATGAGFGQVVWYSVAPQVIVKTLGVFIYRLDANLRHSTVVGIVGAGGIGTTLSSSFSRYDYDFACAILLTIAAMVALGEWFSDWARRKIR